MKSLAHIFHKQLTTNALVVTSALCLAGSCLANPTNPNTNLTIEQQASRFLAQATCGPTQQEINELTAALQKSPNTAYADWIRKEVEKPVSDADLSLPTFRTEMPPNYPRYGFRQQAREAAALRAAMMVKSDLQLRYRVAWALSQIFVVSIQGDLIGSPEGLCDWQDLLVKNAFGKFEDLLMAVTTHPCMGNYLTSANNAKANFASPGSRPDENYAREVMQLFSIGLYQLKPNGDYIVSAGHLVPTYDNDSITELARVFTGMTYPKGPGEKFSKDRDGNAKVTVNPKANVRFGMMDFDSERHDPGRKSFLGNLSVRANQSAEQDISQVIGFLSKHPSTGPFIARALIQRLVTSNPSPAYIQAVSDTFRRSDGDMQAVITAILLNPEARAPNLALRETAGKLREPWLRFTQMARAFQVRFSENAPYLPTFQTKMLPAFGQFPLASPSVFNFYLPTYEPPGEIIQRNERLPVTAVPLVGPEFQILHATTAIDTPNYFLEAVNETRVNPKAGMSISLDLDPQIRLADKPDELLNNVDTLLTSGMMSSATRTIILKAIKSLPDDTDEAKLERAKLAVYLTLVSPDYAVQK